MEISGGRVKIISIEDLIVDRLSAFKRWFHGRRREYASASCFKSRYHQQKKLEDKVDSHDLSDVYAGIVKLGKQVEKEKIDMETATDSMIEFNLLHFHSFPPNYMRNIKLLIEYEGTAYCGWQRQMGLPTVQGALVEAIRKLIGAEVELSGSSRTDAGVHALGQVANFKTASGISLYNVLRGLNFHLPEDIVVRQADEAPPEFDSRHDSKGKTYIYRIINRPQRPALMRNFAWHVWRPLDIGLMAEAANHIIGEKDFASFMAADAQVLHSTREVTSVDIRRVENDLVEIEVMGRAFLRHMVRIMTGTLVEVGVGRLSPDAVRHIIAAQDRRRASRTAPPHGLTLMRVEY